MERTGEHILRAKRFQFSLSELLLLSALAGVALVAVVPRLLLSGTLSAASLAAPEARGEMLTFTFAVFALSVVGGIAGLWCAHRRGWRRQARAVALAAGLLAAAIGVPLTGNRVWQGLVTSRIRSSENSAIAACKIYAEAQDHYRRTDWDNDGVLEYAQDMQALAAARSKRGADALLPADFAAAEVPTGPPSGGTPYHGYVFKVLTGQGTQAPGGSKTYVVAGSGPSANSMTLGYGLVAAPVVYGYTGINTFIINNTGTVYQQDFGEATPQVFSAITAYDPPPYCGCE